MLQTPTTGRDQYVADAIAALAYRADDNSTIQLSAGAAKLASRPLWTIAAETLQHAGHHVDIYGDREQIAENAMSMGDAGRHQTFYSDQENHRYVQASSPSNRPGDFPAILSGLANKYLDIIELDDDYSYAKVSAVTPNALRDMRPTPLVSMGVSDELDELADAEQFAELGFEEEVLSYLFIRRFGNKFGWTPAMIANDDMGAFSEGMIGLREAWEITQNGLVLGHFTSTENLLDGSPLFANRANTGDAENDNLLTSGSTPSDAAWAAMTVKYSKIGGIGTGRRVRGKINTAFVPTGERENEAIRTFDPLNVGGLEQKVANTTANVGIFRNRVSVVGDSELNGSSDTTWFGLRNPTSLKTATVVRSYFAGFGQRGKRESWYDFNNKTTYVSLEGRIATAVKNWRYAIKNQA